MAMCTFFSLTTPAGVVIGIGVSNGYDEASKSANLAQGMY